MGVAVVKLGFRVLLSNYCEVLKCVLLLYPWLHITLSHSENGAHVLLSICFAEFCREVTDMQIPQVAPVILPEMYKIFIQAEVRHMNCNASFSN